MKIKIKTVISLKLKIYDLCILSYFKKTKLICYKICVLFLLSEL